MAGTKLNVSELGIKSGTPDNGWWKIQSFRRYGVFQFWILSTLFYLTFPLSLLIAFLVLGPVRTRQFVSAPVHDFLQTVLILIAVFTVVAWGVFTLLFQ